MRRRGRNSRRSSEEEKWVWPGRRSSERSVKSLGYCGEAATRGRKWREQRPDWDAKPGRRQRLPLEKRCRQRRESFWAVTAGISRVELELVMVEFMIFLVWGGTPPRAICMNVKTKGLQNLMVVSV